VTDRERNEMKAAALSARRSGLLHVVNERRPTAAQVLRQIREKTRARVARWRARHGRA
jgi:hypothetical protein